MEVEICDGEVRECAEHVVEICDQIKEDLSHAVALAGQNNFEASDELFSSVVARLQHLRGIQWTMKEKCEACEIAAEEGNGKADASFHLLRNELFLKDYLSREISELEAYNRRELGIEDLISEEQFAKVKERESMCDHEWMMERLRYEMEERKRMKGSLETLKEKVSEQESKNTTERKILKGIDSHVHDIERASRSLLSLFSLPEELPPADATRLPRPLYVLFVSAFDYVQRNGTNDIEIRVGGDPMKNGDASSQMLDYHPTSLKLMFHGKEKRSMSIKLKYSLKDDCVVVSPGSSSGQDIFLLSCLLDISDVAKPLISSNSCGIYYRWAQEICGYRSFPETERVDFENFVRAVKSRIVHRRAVRKQLDHISRRRSLHVPDGLSGFPNTAKITMFECIGGKLPEKYKRSPDGDVEVPSEQLFECTISCEDAGECTFRFSISPGYPLQRPKFDVSSLTLYSSDITPLGISEKLQRFCDVPASDDSHDILCNSNYMRILLSDELNSLSVDDYFQELGVREDQLLTLQVMDIVAFLMVCEGVVKEGRFGSFRMRGRDRGFPNSPLRLFI